jgi:hypothetical protein
MREMTSNADGPPINLVKHALRLRFTILLLKVLSNPLDKVVLESSLYHLMEEVRGEQLVNIGTRKVGREWLWFTE